MNKKNNSISIATIKKLQNKKISYKVFCSNCGEAVQIEEINKIKYAPKFYIKACSKCAHSVEGEWKKLVNGKN